MHRQNHIKFVVVRFTTSEHILLSGYRWFGETRCLHLQVKGVTHHELRDCKLKSDRLLHFQQPEDFAIMLLFFQSHYKSSSK